MMPVGHKHTPEARAKMAAKAKAAWADPTKRARITKAQRAVAADPVVKNSRIAAIKTALADPVVRALRAEKSQATKAANIAARMERRNMMLEAIGG